MRRPSPTPTLELTPVMGLVTVLVAMLLMGSQLSPIAVVSSHLPAL